MKRSISFSIVVAALFVFGVFLVSAEAGGGHRAESGVQPAVEGSGMDTVIVDMSRGNVLANSVCSVTRTDGSVSPFLVVGKDGHALIMKHETGVLICKYGGEYLGGWLKNHKGGEVKMVPYWVFQG